MAYKPYLKRNVTLVKKISIYLSIYLSISTKIHQMKYYAGSCGNVHEYYGHTINLEQQ